MLENIKITLPKNVHETLASDCKNFNIIKADGVPNINEFINRLIVNYYERFTASEEGLYDAAKNTIRNLPERYKEAVFDDILKIVRNHEKTPNESTSVRFTFKPTKNSEGAVTFIENFVLRGESLSSFYRRMFSSYASQRGQQREIIIFKDNYEVLMKALKKGVKVGIALKSNSIKSASVYAVAPAKEELYNYILSTDGKSLFTVRLANVKSVFLLAEKAEIDDETAKIFDRQIRCGVQYPIYKGEEEPVKVKFSHKGLYLFDRIYLYRPTPIKKEGNVYWFDCSYNHAIHYFKRFGYDAVILEPKQTAEMMLKFYEDSTKKCARHIEKTRKK